MATVRGITATIGTGGLPDQKPPVSTGKTTDPLVAAQTLVGLTTTTVGGMTTVQITTVQAAAVQLSAALGADVFVSANLTTIPTTSKLRAALEAVARTADGDGGFTP